MFGVVLILFLGNCSSSTCDGDRTIICENDLCAGCMDPGFNRDNSIDSPNDCNNGFIDLGPTPTSIPTFPTFNPTSNPTRSPTFTLISEPSDQPTAQPSNTPAGDRSNSPTNIPTDIPSNISTNVPTNTPTSGPLNDATLFPVSTITFVLYILNLIVVLLCFGLSLFYCFLLFGFTLR